MSPILDYGVYDKSGKAVGIINNNDEYRIVMRVKFNEHIDSPIFAMGIKDRKGCELCGANTNEYKVATGSFDAGDIATVEFAQSIPLAVDTYTVSFGCTRFDAAGNLEVFDRHYDALFLDVTSDRKSIGILDIKTKISIKQKEKEVL